MKVLLINPPASYRQDYNVKNYSPKIPLGLGYIAAILEREGHEVEILDSAADDCKRTLNKITTFGSIRLVTEKILRFRPQIVGISCVFSSRINNALTCAAIAKILDKSTTTVIGGIHPTILPEKVLSNKNVDVIALGESDFLLSKILRKVPLEEIDGVGYKENGETIVNPKTKWIEDLDSLPFPARHLLPMEKYLAVKPVVRADGRETVRLLPRISVSTSRGCPFNCNFCASFKMWGRKWRFRSPESVVEEIEQIIKTYGVNQVSFEDDNITVNKERMLKLCQLIVDKNLNIRWDTPNGVCVKTLDHDLLAKMKESGCYSLNLAIETANEKLLRKIGKTHSIEHLERVAKSCRKLGIKTLGYFVIGTPGETEETVEESIDLAVNLLLDEINVFVATPYAGTRLYEECLEKDYINISDYEDFIADDDYQQTTALINTPFLSSKRLSELRYYFYDEFNKKRKK